MAELSNGRRKILALEFLSLHTSNLPILAALGAVTVGWLGWAWWFRGMRATVCFCAVSIAWWLVFIVPSF